jgi:hypothetical protein
LALVLDLSGERYPEAHHIKKQFTTATKLNFKLMANYIFKATLQHDNGKKVIKTNASNREQAIQNICNAENCPPQAIKEIYILQVLN